MLRVINIAEGTSVDGPGLRTSIYFAGCQHMCPGCHNPDSWPMSAGRDWSVDDLMKTIRYNRFPVTFSGGDPMYQAEQLIPLARAIRILFNEHPDWRAEGGALWCYTGFCYEDIKDRSPYRELLEYIDVLVDGPFVQELKPQGPALRFRGSTNQRFIRPATGEILHIDTLLASFL